MRKQIDMAIDNSGNIVAGGYAVSSGVAKLALARYTSSGCIDGTFGTGGTTLTTVGTGATINAVAFDASQNIVVAGSAIVSGVPNFVVARYTSAGAWTLLLMHPVLFRGRDYS